jgi:hypothetical protein
MMDKKGLSARRGKRQPTFEVPMRKMMVTVVALSAVAFCGPAFAIENPFDVAAVQIVGQTQTFEGGPNGTIVTLQFPVVHNDPNGRYSKITNKYTASKAGYYLFTADVGLNMSDCLTAALLFVIENPNGTSSARYVAADFSTVYGGKARHFGGSMIRALPAGAKVSVSLDVDAACRHAFVDAFQGAHFSGGRM